MRVADAVTACFCRVEKLENELVAERMITNRLLGAVSVIDPDAYEDIIDGLRITAARLEEAFVASKVSKATQEKRATIVARLTEIVGPFDGSNPPPAFSIIPGGKSD